MNRLAKNWSRTSLSEAYWFQEGPGVRNWQFTLSGIKLLNVANITKLGTIDLGTTGRYLGTKEVEKKYKHFLVDEGDLVIASSGISFDIDGLLRTRGAFVRKEHLPLCMNTSTIRFKAKDGVSDLLFLKYWLDSFEFREQITRQVTGSAQQNFGPSHLKSTWISLPPLPEQKRIAAILDKADRLRRLRRYALELGDTYLQSVFLEMFGDALAGKDKNAPLTPLEQVCTKITDGTHVTPTYLESGVPFLSVKNLTQVPGRLDFSEVKYISPEQHEQMWKACPVERDDVLYTKVGTYGIPQIVETDIRFSIFVSVALLKPDKTVIIPKYLESALRTDFAKRQADKLVSGIGVPDLHLREIKTMLIPLPDFSRQVRFVEVARKYERLREQQREAERQAEHLFQSLLHQAFRP